MIVNPFNSQLKFKAIYIIFASTLYGIFFNNIYYKRLLYVKLIGSILSSLIDSMKYYFHIKNC